MKSEQGQISPIQFMFVVACFLQASSLLSSYIIGIVAHDAWFPILAGALLCLILLSACIWLSNRFPGKNLVQINNIVFGKPLGTLASLMYLWFFLSLASLNLRDMSDFVSMAIMPNTSTIVLMVTFLLVCAWAVRHGIEVVTRYSSLFAFFAIGVLVVGTLLNLGNMHLDSFLPMMQMPVMKYVQATNIVMAIPFGELIVIMMIIPSVQRPEKAKDLRGYLLGGFGIGVLIILLVVLRDTAVLGNTLPFFSLPSFESLRMISLGNVLSRIEILIAMVLIILMFFRVSLFYFITVLTLSEILSLKSYRMLVLLIGALIVLYANIMYPDTFQHVNAGLHIQPIIWLWFEYLLPLLTVLVAALRGLRTPREEAAGPQTVKEGG